MRALTCQVLHRWPGQAEVKGSKNMVDLPRRGLEGGVGERRRGGRWWRGQQTAVGGGERRVQTCSVQDVQQAGCIRTPQADSPGGPQMGRVAPESRGRPALGSLPAELKFPQRLRQIIVTPQGIPHLA